MYELLNRYSASRKHERMQIGTSVFIAITSAVLTTAGYTVVKASDLTDASQLNMESLPHVMEENITNGMTAGVASILNEVYSETEKSTDITYIEEYGEPIYIRCTGYNDIGYTKSGEWTREGGIAGKEEWLGKQCYIYEVTDSGECGDLIGVYDFIDTGFGIKYLDGEYYANGSLTAGKSIDIWHESEEAVWNWAATYGDYVYIQIVDKEENI
jgi:hypothetical protein